MPKPQRNALTEKLDDMIWPDLNGIRVPHRFISPFTLKEDDFKARNEFIILSWLRGRRGALGEIE